MNEILVELFSSKVRAAVLAWMLPRPHLGASLTDLSRTLDLPVSSLQHECYKLERIEILSARRAGNARLYRVRPDCPIRLPLAALVAAAIGPAAALRASLEGVSGLAAAFLAGALPGWSDEPDHPATRAYPTARTHPSGAPVSAERPHLVLIGDIPLDVLDDAVRRAEAVVGLPRESIELAYFRLDDWHRRLAEGHPYVLGLVDGPRVPLVGAVTGR